MNFTPELRDTLTAQAHACGFSLCGVAAVPDAGSEEDAAERNYFAGWIAQGHGGEMGYLARADEQGSLLRSSLRVALPWAESVIVCAVDYSADAPLSIDPAPADAGWIARYAWSGDAEKNPTDYHNVMLGNLRAVESALHEHCGDGEEKIQTRCYVDTGPIVERTFARYAGVGWVGKNTCLLNEQRGSWLLLGVIVTSLRLPGELSVTADRCGSCTRCIDACPTQALVAPRQMDASRCIAYLTIEKKGSIDEALRPLMGRQVFGCDICQDVCPWNAKAERTRPIQSSAPIADEMQSRAELINPPLAWLASLDPPEFKRLFRGSPLERTKLKGLHRNVAIAMGNSGEAKFLPQLEQWTRAEDKILRETATWAFDRLK